MWAFDSSELAGKRGWHFAVKVDGRAATFAEVLSALKMDGTFRTAWSDVLARCPFPAFRFETPPVSASSSTRAFEFVLLSSPELEVDSNPEAFREHFDEAPEAPVVAFWNLGRDALLIVPKPLGELDAYPHLGAFVRRAPAAQRDALWQRVAESMLARMANAASQRVWLSTAGAGVPWLHVRLDSTPKYYGHAPFRQA